MHNILASGRTLHGGVAWGWVRGDLGWVSGENFSPQGWLSTGEGASGRWPWHQAVWVQESFGKCSQDRDVIIGVSCMGPGVGLDNPVGSLPTQYILWFYMYLFCMDSCVLKSLGSFTACVKPDVFLHHCISDMGMLFPLYCTAGGCTLLSSWKSIRKKYCILGKALKFTESFALFTCPKVDLQLQVKSWQVPFGQRWKIRKNCE